MITAGSLNRAPRFVLSDSNSTHFGITASVAAAAGVKSVLINASRRPLQAGDGGRTETNCLQEPVGGNRFTL